MQSLVVRVCKSQADVHDSVTARAIYENTWFVSAGGKHTEQARKRFCRS